MADLFESLRGVSALEAVQRLGWPLRRSGGRHWTCCPLHGEKTPSMCFYEDGGWYCFGCHRGGDAIRLYQEYYSLSPHDAAVRLAQDSGISIPDRHGFQPAKKPQPTVYDLARALERRRSAEWARLCDAVHRADAVLAKYDNRPDRAWDSPEFMMALRGRSYAGTRLDWLWQASLTDLALEYKEADDA